MKKIAVFIFFAVLSILVSCEQKVTPEEDTPLEHETEALIHKIPEGDLEILEIDGCEYIVFKETVPEHANHGYGYMAHKGNCKNPIHYHYNSEVMVKTTAQKDSVNN